MSWALMQEFAREKMNRPTAHLAAVTVKRAEWGDGFDGLELQVADAPLLTKGANKGKPNWRKKTDVQKWGYPHAEFDAYKAAWSERTGNCLGCFGEGQTFVRWNRDEGTTYRTCKACDGTGRVS